MTKALGYAAKHSFSRLKPLAFEREAPGPSDVEIDVLYCGVCHSDVHQVENDWGNTVYGAAALVKPNVTLGRGMAFGVATELVIDQAIVPALGLANPFWKCPVQWHLRGLAAHIVFGAATDTTRRLFLSLFDVADMR